MRHPEYKDDSSDWYKYRLTYKGGRQFIDAYLERFSKREGEEDFNSRRTISYNPAFAKAALNKQKNTIYSRMGEINRIGGSTSYQDCVQGKAGGVDLYGSSMNTFMGQEVILELMKMGKVGVYVDKPVLDGNLLARNREKKPYLYIYKAEDICTWSYQYVDGEQVFVNVLLRDTNYEYDQETGMTLGMYERFRQMWIGADKKVHVQFWKRDDDPKSDSDIKVGEEMVLDLERIPFVLLSLSDSLLSDVADYQISMMNLASADVAYVFRANFPLYTEQYDPASESVHTRRPLPTRTVTADDGTTSTTSFQGTADEARLAAYATAGRVGASDGRRYPKGLNKPEFIAPSAEPLMASLSKQDRMREEIYMLIDIATANVQPMHASAESKSAGMEGLESGLSYIGMELQWGEREIAKLWAMYEGGTAAEVNYPEKYTLKSDAQRIEEAKALDEVKTSAPSKTFAKAVTKQIAHVMLRDRISDAEMDTIITEIDAAEFISSDPELIKAASELGMVDQVTGSNALGFNGAKVVPIAQKEHTERLAEIAKSQATGAPRGVGDLGPIKGKEEQGRLDKRRRNPDKPPKGRGPASGT